MPSPSPDLRRMWREDVTATTNELREATLHIAKVKMELAAYEEAFRLAQARYSKAIVAFKKAVCTEAELTWND